MAIASSSAGEGWPAQVELRNGRRVTLRPIVPGDRKELLDAFERLSHESRYSRFMAPMKALSDGMIERAVNPAAGREFALVALTAAGGEEDIVGGARYAVEPDGESCEFAVAIADDWNGVGLGSRLMRELIRAAQARGLKRMHGFVLSQNSAMLGLAQRLGFSVGPSSEGPTVKLVSLDLGQGGAGPAAAWG
jgi:RimJ/RimL family protein N-acetyltransferase